MTWLTGDHTTAPSLGNSPARALSFIGRLYPRPKRAGLTSLAALLELDPARLEDLGLVRQDVIDAMRQPAPGMTLARRRAHRASAWLRGHE